MSVSENCATEATTLVRRFRDGIEIGYAVHGHRNYRDASGSQGPMGKDYLLEYYEHDAVTLNLRNDSVYFVDCPGLSTEHELATTPSVFVNASGKAEHRAS